MSLTVAHSRPPERPSCLHVLLDELPHTESGKVRKGSLV